MTDQTIRAIRSRCVFCESGSGQRSKEHVFRRDFKKSFPEASRIAFSHLSEGELELVERPISQFDMTLNRVCRDCNQGWLNDLEGVAWPVIEELTTGNRKSSLSHDEVRTLGLWAYVRALLRTHISPKGQAPRVLLRQVYETRAVPSGCFVALGASPVYVWEAGTHQSALINPGAHYLGFVAFGLGALVFLVAVSDSSPVAAASARDLIEQPRRWFPGCFRGLAPVEIPVDGLRLLAGDQARMAGLSMAVSYGISDPVDQTGMSLDPFSVIPAAFHQEIALRRKARAWLSKQFDE